MQPIWMNPARLSAAWLALSLLLALVACRAERPGCQEMLADIAAVARAEAGERHPVLVQCGGALWDSSGDLLTEERARAMCAHDTQFCWRAMHTWNERDSTAELCVYQYQPNAPIRPALVVCHEVRWSRVRGEWRISSRRRSGMS